MDQRSLQSDEFSETHSALEAVADATLLVDNHAHPFWIPSVAGTHIPELATLITEAKPIAYLPPMTGRATLAFCRSLRDLQALLIPDSRQSEYNHALDEESEQEAMVERARAEMGVWNLARRCFGAAGIAAVLIDDGLGFPHGFVPASLEDFSEKCNVPVAKRILRLETEGEKVLESMLVNQKRAREGMRSSPEKRPRRTFKAELFQREMIARLKPLPADVVSFKSIAAYRSGLEVNLDWTEEDLEEALETSLGEPRITNKVIVDYTVRIGLEVAREMKIPIQFHCGYGDIDMDIDKGNPVLLRQVFQRYPDVDVVLLHGAWPYTRLAAYLASVYPHVHLDFGLAIPLLSVSGMFNVVSEALEVAPITKLLFSSDASSAPDVFYLAARWGRRVVAAVIARSVASGDLTLQEGKAAVRKLLAENAVQLYRLELPP